MGNILVVAEQFEGVLRKSTLAAITCAQALQKARGGDVHILVIGAGVDGAAQALIKYGAKSVFSADALALKDYFCELYAPVVLAAVEKTGADVVLSPSGTFSKDLLPRVAVKMGAALVSDIMGVVSAMPTLKFKRPACAGNAITSVEVLSPKCAGTVRATDFGAPAENPAASPVEALAVSAAPPANKKFVSFQVVKSARPELTEASVVISVGRGTKGPEGIKLAEELADALNAAIGASRAVVDSGWLPNDLQVGQTGKIIAPKLYIGIGISGAIQHVAGIRGAKTIVAINKDEEAPIFAVADYGLVADLFTAVPEFTAGVKKIKAAG